MDLRERSGFSRLRKPLYMFQSFSMKVLISRGERQTTHTWAPFTKAFISQKILLEENNNFKFIFSVCVLEATPYGAKKLFPAYSLSLPIVIGNNMAPSHALQGFALSL